MAIRHLWFLFSLALAVLVASQAPAFLPDLLSDLAGRTVAAQYTPFFAGDAVVRAAGIAALGGLVVFLLGFLAPAAFDGIVRSLARRALVPYREEVIADLTPRDLALLLGRYWGLGQQVEAYAEGLRDYSLPGSDAKPGVRRLTSPRPAAAVFGSMRGGDTLYRWFFDSLPLALAGFGILLFLAGVAQPLQSGAEPALRPAILALLIAAGAGLIVAVIKRAVSALHERQSLSFCDTLDRLYPPLAETDRLLIAEGHARMAALSVTEAISATRTEIGKTLDTRLKDWAKAAEKSNEALRQNLVSTMKPTLDALRETQESAASTYVEQSRQALDAVLARFLEGMDVHFAGQMKELSETLEETRKTAKSTDAAYRKALESHSDQVAEQLGVYAGSFGQTAASFETLQGSVDGLLTLTAPLLRQVIAHQEALLKAIEDETTASKVIGRAASELSAAAQASRETVGQFITLAERLREANKAAGGGNAGGGSDKRVVQALRALRSGFGETDEAS